MTLQAIKDALSVKFFKVGAETLVKTFEPNVKLWSIPVIEKEGDVMWENNIQICQNGDADEYYWKNSEPKSGMYVFQKEVEAYVKQKVADWTIEGVKSSSYDISNKRVFLIVIKNNAGILNEIKVWIDKDGTGNLRYRVVV